mgnify:CR=1 FL=1
MRPHLSPKRAEDARKQMEKTGERPPLPDDVVDEDDPLGERADDTEDDDED